MQAAMFTDEQVPVMSRPQKGNPCILVYGAGPEGKRCKSCALLYAKRYANMYYKCRLRPDIGPASDHRVNWPACGKYQEAEAEQE